MKVRQVLFIQGGGKNGYREDEALVLSLKKNLGNEYHVDYPEIGPDESSADFGWIKQIEEIINRMNQEFILVGHSFGASMILKYFSENDNYKNVEAIFLLSTPFWSGNEKWQAGLKLKQDFADKLPDAIPIFFYHCRDDTEVPISHFHQYKNKLPKASYCEIISGGHQLNNDLTLVASDIKAL